MNQTDLEIFNEFAKQIHLQYPESKVWFFGSRARGDSHSDSDFDILVVIKNLTKKEKKIFLRLHGNLDFQKI